MSTWDKLNKQVEENSQQKPADTGAWGDFNYKMGEEAIQQESMSQTGVSTSLFQELKRRGATHEYIESLKPKKISMGKEMLTAAKDTGAGLFDQMFRNIRGISHIAATPAAWVMATVPGGATPTEAAAESMNMAWKVMSDKNVSVDVGVDKAAEMYLEKYAEKTETGYKPTVKNVVALTALGVFNVFGDPALEFGIGLKGAKALKEFAQFKKVGRVAKLLEEGAKFVGTGKNLEIPISNDLKVKIKPKGKKIVIEGYKKRFPKQKALPKNKVSDETAEVIMGVRETMGREVTAKFSGDDLIIKPNIQDKEIATAGRVATVPEKDIATINKAKLKESKISINDISLNDDFKAAQDDIKNGKMSMTKQPVLLGKDGDKIYVKDGNHRIAEAISKGETEISSTFDEKTYLQQNKKTVEPTVEPEEKTPDIKLKPIGTGEIKTSKLARGVEEKAIEKKLVESISDLPEYKKVNLKEQSKLANNLLKENKEMAINIAKGEEPAPHGILPESIFTATEEYAIKTKNVELIMELARSSLSTEATAMGQRIRALGERNPDSPVSAIKRISKARKESLSKKSKATKKAKDKIKKEIKAQIKKPKRGDWEGFIESIKC